MLVLRDDLDLVKYNNYVVFSLRKVIVVGDLNCPREAIDSAYIQDTPTLLHGCPERDRLKIFIVSSPPLPPLPPLPPPSVLLDTFRFLHPDQPEAYTCWSTFFGYRYCAFASKRGEIVGLLVIGFWIVYCILASKCQ